MALPSFPWPFRRGAAAADVPGKASSSSSASGSAEELGITPELLAYLNTLTADDFRSFARHFQEQGGGSDGGDEVKGDITEWQQQHAVAVLSKAKEFAKIRYYLCPRHMKDKQFWRIYFLIVKQYVSLYELNDIKKRKLQKMGAENGDPRSTSAIEVEMQESSRPRMSTSAALLDSQSSD